MQVYTRTQLDVNKHSEGQALSEWVPFIHSGRNEQETNMAAYITAGHVFMMASKDIKADSALLVWFDDDYASLLRIPPLPPFSFYGQ